MRSGSSNWGRNSVFGSGLLHCGMARVFLTKHIDKVAGKTIRISSERAT
jgi:hypothetical protein